MSKIYTNDKGHKVVEIDTVLFTGKRKIDWNGVEKYLKRYIGDEYVIFHFKKIQSLNILRMQNMAGIGVL